MRLLERLAERWREHPLVFLGAVLHRIPFHPIRLVYFQRVALEGEPAPPTRGHAAIPIRRADRGDLERLVQCIDKRALFEERFDSGEACLVGEEGGRIVGYEWFSSKERLVEERYRYRFAIPSDALYAYDAYTAESHRERGVWRQIIAATSTLKTPERRRIVAHVEYGNPGSIVAHRRVGFRPIERYLFLSVLGLKLLARTWVAPGANAGNRVQ